MKKKKKFGLEISIAPPRQSTSIRDTFTVTTQSLSL